MESKLHIYTGEGKGKTTAAMGLALRSLGHGYEVLVAQFMKNGCSGELAAFKRFPGARISTAEPIAGFTSRMTQEELCRASREQTAHALSLIEQIAIERPRLIVLDELGVAAYRNLMDEETVRRLVDTALACGETVVTGRFMPLWLISRGDYISRIVPERHPFQTEGLKARKGVEW